MGEWTWLHVLFPLADIELMQPPIDATAANVLVRTVKLVSNTDLEKEESERTSPGGPTPDSRSQTAERRYIVRVAPHHVAPFKGGPWLHEFSESELAEPGSALAAFRSRLAEQIEKARSGSGSNS